MTGEEAGILRLWREMIGEEQPEDLSDVWAAQLGSATEQLNLDWNIINKENAAQKLAAQEKKTGSSTFFALTAQGYQNLSINVGELRRYIQQQKATIEALKKYYEAHKDEIKQKVKDYKEKTNYNSNIPKEKKQEYNKRAYLKKKEKIIFYKRLVL